jgi:pimeloyl-ACP methyl ester carboxylesterase
MPKVRVNGLNLYYEETGSGAPLLFLHESSGDYRSWEGQVRFFSRRYRCITTSARGFPPSDVPEQPEQYSQDHLIADVLGLLDALKIDKAHLCGLSMGANTTLFFGLRHPQRVRSMTIAGAGYGAGGERPAFRKMIEGRARRFLDEGIEQGQAPYMLGPVNVQFRNKDPRGWELHCRRMLEHSPEGVGYTLLGVQRNRPDIMSVGEEMRRCHLPALILLGDEDLQCLEGSVFMKRCLSRSGMLLFPRSGHLVNLEEPALFNQVLLDFLTAVDGGAWGPRDPLALTALT